MHNFEEEKKTKGHLKRVRRSENWKKKRLTQLITKVTFDIELSQENFQQQKNLKATQKLNCKINKKIKFMTQRKSSICLKGEKKAKRKNRKK